MIAGKDRNLITKFYNANFIIIQTGLWGSIRMIYFQEFIETVYRE